MEQFFGFRNFRQFERSRKEIRLPYDLLNDLRFRQLPDASKAHLICLLLLSARMDNILPNNPLKLEQLIGATDSVDLSAFADFVAFAQVEEPTYDDRSAKRRISDPVRAEVLLRDGARCRRCRTAVNLEVDHIIPVSKGGRTEEANLQTLCRRCNRRKWKKLIAGLRLTMNDESPQPRSIAAELALLFLRELEPRVPEDPELLVSTEAVLSFAAIRHADPLQWEHWWAILEKYEKSDLIEYMLCQPARSEDLEWQSRADRLIGLASDAGLELFHDPDQQGWASVRVDTHWENYPIRARAFQLFLLRIYYLNTGESPGSRVIRAAAELFEARALFDGEECPVHLRVAVHGGRLYLDLSDRAWRAVEIDDQGWRVVERPPAKFRRPRGAQPLPEPERGGSLDELRPFFNVDRHGWILIRAFLVAALRPGFPLPILVAKGEQGSGKSTACRVISSLIDPRTSALRGVPREVRDLTAAARNSWLVCFDNLSRLPEDLADAACRLATGGGFGGRQLYSDHDEAIFDATRPLVFNAIPDLGTTRPDFLDRTLIVEFLSIMPEVRRDEAQFWREFSERRPRILGALLDSAVAALRNLPQVRLERPPRLADFALWVTACEEALGMEPGEAVTACQTNSAEARDLALEASPLYGPLAELAREGFTGTVADLHARLDSMVSDAMRRSVRWPKAPNGLGNALRRMATNLRAAGVELQFSRNDVQGRRVVSVVRTAQSRKTPSVAVSSRQ